jgi:hypothetical protein
MKLGYNFDEIPYLQPDAVALIVEDVIRRPSRGIPQQWKISPRQYEVLSDDVRIVSHQEAEELLETANKKQRKKTAVGEPRKTPVEDHNSDIDNDDRDAAYGSRPSRAEKQTTGKITEMRDTGVNNERRKKAPWRRRTTHARPYWAGRK